MERCSLPLELRVDLHTWKLARGRHFAVFVQQFQVDKEPLAHGVWRFGACQRMLRDSFGEVASCPEPHFEERNVGEGHLEEPAADAWAFVGELLALA